MTLASSANPSEQFHIARERGRWVLQPSMDMTEFGLLTAITNPNVEESPVYRRTIEKLFLGNVLTQLMNEGSMSPTDFRPGFPPVGSRIVTGNLNVRQRALWMMITLEGIAEGHRLDIRATTEHVPRWATDLEPQRPSYCNDHPMGEWVRSYVGKGPAYLKTKLRSLCKTSLRSHLAIGGSVVNSQFLVNLYHLAELTEGCRSASIGTPPPAVMVAQYDLMDKDYRSFHRWLADPKAQREAAKSHRLGHLSYHFNDRLKPDLSAPDITFPYGCDKMYFWIDQERYPDHELQAATLGAVMRAASDMTETPLETIADQIVIHAVRTNEALDPGTYRPTRVPPAFKQNKQVYDAFSHAVAQWG